MDTEGLRQRSNDVLPKADVDLGAGSNLKHPQEPHPIGSSEHGPAVQILRLITSVSYFLVGVLSAHFTQFFGTPLYWYDRNMYYAWMSLTKQSFGLIMMTITQWFTPSVMRVSWDSSVRGELAQTADGRLETRFPERIVLMANHQIYTDWIFLWWMAYTSRMHGHIYIILKESLKYIPVLGPGMMFFGFIFMARSWAKDKPRLQHRLEKLAKSTAPMWLLIFPEGTNLSANTRKKSLAWSEKSGIPDGQHVLLPRATGMYFCLQELRGRLDWVYDCTVAYEGVRQGEYAQDFFTLRSTFLQGRTPKSVNFHWRKFAVKDIPLDSQEAFEKWVLQRWREKDEMIQQFLDTGRLPCDNTLDISVEGKQEDKYIETEVKLANYSELLQIFAVPLTVIMVLNGIRRFYRRFS